MRAVKLVGCLTALLALGLLLGCGGGAKTTNLAPTPAEKTMETIPDWFLNTPSDPSYIFATASMTSRDMQLAIQKAETQAKNSLSGQLEQKLGNVTKQFQEEVGVGEDSELLQQFSSATKVVTKQTLVGARTDQKKLVPEKGIYRAYVLMSLPIGAANKALMDKIKANQNLYTRFQATQAFDDLNKELEAYDEGQ